MRGVVIVYYTIVGLALAVLLYTEYQNRKK